VDKVLYPQWKESAKDTVQFGSISPEYVKAVYQAILDAKWTRSKILNKTGVDLFRIDVLAGNLTKFQVVLPNKGEFASEHFILNPLDRFYRWLTTESRIELPDHFQITQHACCNSGCAGCSVKAERRLLPFLDGGYNDIPWANDPRRISQE